MNQRDKAKAVTRSLVVKTAQAQWKKPGSYESRTIRDLAKVMGRSTGAIFAHFEGKESLWRAAFPGREPPIDCALTRAASDMRVLLEAAAPLLRENGYPTSADMIAALLASIDAPVGDDVVGGFDDEADAPSLAA